MEFVFTESRYRWKPALRPFATSPLSGVLKGYDRLGIPGDRFDKVIVTNG